MVNSKVIAIGAGSVITAVAGGLLISKAVKSRRKKVTKRKYSAKNSGKRSSKRVRRTPRTAGKGKDRSTKRIRYTKNGQPYILLKSGKAKFIKKKSAKLSHKRKGGRY